MRISFKRAATSVLLALLALAGLTAAAMAEPTNLFSGVAPDVAASSKSPAPTGPIVRQRTVSLNLAAFSLASADTDAPRPATPVELRITLFPDASAVFKESGAEAAFGGGSIWRGEAFNGDATLVLARGQITGHVSLRGKTYKISPAAGGVQTIVEVAIDRLAPDGPHVTPPRMNRTLNASPDVAAPQADTEKTAIIGVFAAYTGRARTASGDILSDINLAIDLTNQAFVSSAVHIRLRLVGTQLVARYNETLASYEDSLYSLTGVSSGSAQVLFDPIRAKRDATKADLMVLIRSEGSYCGIGWLNQTPDPTYDAPYGASVTSVGCISGLTAGHEIGHNMGLHHDRYVEPAAPNTAYNYGFVNVTKRVRDVMSYTNECSDNGVFCTRVNMFSNPSKKAGGRPFGIPRGQPGATDGARKLNQNRFLIAKFRD